MFFLSFQTYMIHPCFIYFKREIFKRLLLKSEAAALLEPDYQHTGPGPTVQKEPTWLGHTSSCRNIFSIFFKIFIQSWWTSDSSASHLHFPRVPHVQHSYLVLTWGGWFDIVEVVTTSTRRQSERTRELERNECLPLFPFPNVFAEVAIHTGHLHKTFWEDFLERDPTISFSLSSKSERGEEQ